MADPRRYAAALDVHDNLPVGPDHGEVVNLAASSRANHSRERLAG